MQGLVCLQAKGRFAMSHENKALTIVQDELGRKDVNHSQRVYQAMQSGE
jgi:hypothetical protein